MENLQESEVLKQKIRKGLEEIREDIQCAHMEVRDTFVFDSDEVSVGNTLLPIHVFQSLSVAERLLSDLITRVKSLEKYI